MKVDVLNRNGESTGRQVELPEEIFGVTPNEHAVYLDVKAYLANQRQGTHSAKERNAIKGSTRKLKRQKGTGTARAGDIKNPLFRGGGRVFGPRVRDYSQKLNKKVKALARKSALADKAQKNKVVVVENFSFDGPKTKEYVTFLSKVSPDTKKTLLLTDNLDKNVYLSARNLPHAAVMKAEEFNTYAVLHANQLIIQEGAIEKISSNLNK